MRALALPGGTERSLLAKLDGAQRNHDTGDTAGACEKLASLADELAARSGKKLPAHDAGALIDDTDAVKVSLACP